MNNASTKASSDGLEMANSTGDLNVAETISLVCPRQMKQDLPTSPAARKTVVESRETIKQILNGADKRVLIIIGPCSIHDEKAALEYAERLQTLREEVAEKLYVVMRVYFEKPRTTIGWKGLINDPYLDGTFDMEAGLRKARQLLLAITEMGMPAGTELLEPITPQYIDDLISWTALGARTTESQTHRQMASGLSMPVGFKNGTEGNLQIAIDAMASAKHAHSFLGINQEGQTSIIKTRGNPWGHIILRGGRNGPNYDAESVAQAIATLRQANASDRIMIDCSHANSAKKFQNQHKVWNDAIGQRVAGNEAVVGLMVESNLSEGNQKLTPEISQLRYGVSITDECIGMTETEQLLRSGHEALNGSA